MSFINIFLSILVLYLIPTGIGSTFFLVTERKSNQIEKYVYGSFIIFALIQIISVPLIVIQSSFSTIYFIIFMFIYSFLVLGLIFNILKNSKKKKRRRKKKKKKKKRKKININLLKIVYYLLLFIAVIIIVLLNNLYQYNGKQDLEYITMVGDIVSSKKVYLINPATGELGKWFAFYDAAKYISSPWPVYLACISRFTHLKPIVLMNNIMPVYLLVLLILVSWLFLQRIIGSKISYKVMFMIIFLLLLFKSSPNYNNPAYLLFVTPYKGEAFLLFAGILFLIICLFNHYHHHTNRNLFILAMVNFAICLMANGGIYLGIIALIIYGIGLLVFKNELQISLRIFMLIIPNILFIAINFVVGRLM